MGCQLYSLSHYFVASRRNVGRGGVLDIRYLVCFLILVRPKISSKTSLFNFHATPSLIQSKLFEF